MSSTRLDGRYAIRLCVLNHSSGAEDIEATLDFLETAEVPAGPPPAPESHERDRDVSSSWVFAELQGDAPVALLPLFHGLSPDELDSVRAGERIAEAGEEVVRQWELSKEFFVLVEGAADIEVDSERVDTIGPGEFFGEVAALDWGGGFGYSPTATVRVTERSRLLVLSGVDLGSVMREMPVIDSRVRAAVAQRLPKRRA